MTGRTRLLLALAGSICLALSALQLAIYLAGFNLRDSDFVGLWGFARFAFAQGATGLYDEAQLRPFQEQLFPDVPLYFPFPYPPWFLFVLAPFGALPFGWARLAWVFVPLAPFLLAAWALGGRRVGVALAVLIMPTSLITALFGQTGFLVGALLGGGLALLPTRPVLAGVLLGLLSVKPHFGLLVPIALLAAGAWRAIFAAGVTVLALALAATLAFGWAVWPAWLGSFAPHVGLVQGAQALQTRLMPTAFVNMLGIGAPSWVAWLAQAVVALVAAAGVWRCYRAGPTTTAAASLLAGALLATPYAFTYDLPMAGLGAVLLVAERLRTDPANPPLPEIALLLVLQLAPIMNFSSPAAASLILGALALLLLLAVVRTAQAQPAAAFSRASSTFLRGTPQR